MIDMENHPNCNGCRLCEKICPVQAITIQADSLDGFLYPVIDKNKCIECHLCEKKCTQLHPVKQEGRKEPRVYAAWSNDALAARFEYGKLCCYSSFCVQGKQELL